MNIPSIISKIFKKILSKQLFFYFQNILSKFQCGFRKVFSTQNCSLLLIEKWKKAVEKD